MTLTVRSGVGNLELLEQDRQREGADHDQDHHRDQRPGDLDPGVVGEARRRRVARAVEAHDHDREQRGDEEHDHRHDPVHPVRQPVHVVGELGHRRLVVHAARDRRADHRQVAAARRPAAPRRRSARPAPASQARRPAADRGSSFIASVRPVAAGPVARRREAPSAALARVAAAGQINHISSSEGTRRGKSPLRHRDASAPVQTSGGTPMPQTPRFRPFETALDPERALGVLREAVAGADDGELFLERRRSEALVFDDGRLQERRATTPPRASACARCAARPPATPIPPRSPRPRCRRAAETARLAVGAGGGTLAAPPRPTNQRLYTDHDPFDDAEFAVKVEMLREIDAYLRGARPARGAGLGHARRLDAGGRDPAPRGRPARRGAADGAAQHLGDRRGERPARIGRLRRRRPPRPRAADRAPAHWKAVARRGAAHRRRQPARRARARRA